MNTKIKSIFKTIALSLGALLLVTTATYAIRTLTPGNTPGEATQYTLNDIYIKLTTGTATSTKSGLFTTPESVVANFSTLTDIYNAIPAELSLVDSTTTVPVGINLATTTLDTIDTDLTAVNIADGVTVFGVMGTLQGATTLEWSTEQTASDWPTASSTCAALIEGGATAGDWRLPTISELLAAISDDWIIDGGASPRFADSTSYWSGTESDGSAAWLAYWFGDVSYYGHGKANSYSVRCVR